MRSTSKRPRLAGYLWQRFPREVALCTGLILLSVLLDACSILILAPVVDLILAEAGGSVSDAVGSALGSRMLDLFDAAGIPRTLWAAAITFLLLSLLRNLIQIGAWRFVYRTQFLVFEKVFRESFSGVTSASWGFFTRHRQGYFISTMTREVANVSSAFAVIAQIAAGVIQILIFMIVPFWISWQLTLICGLFAFAAAIPFLKLAGLNRKFGRVTTESAGEYTGVIQETFSIAKVMHAFGVQAAACAELAAAFARYRDAGVKSLTWRRAVPLLYHPVGMVGLLVAYALASKFEIPLAEFAVILYASWKVLPVLSQLTGECSTLMNYLPSFDAVMDMLEDARRNPALSGRRRLQGDLGAVAFQNVDFRYEGGEEVVLSDLSLEVRPGQMAAFVGSSGAGKTTAADLIMGFYSPTSGKVTVGGISLDDVDMGDYRARIAYVPQESVLLNRSIRDNLCWAKAGADETELWEACRISHSEEFIRRLPDGLDTVVGDRGFRLSGGQVQRLALARAVLRKPQILVLDEATSALDTESERAIQRALESLAGDVTIIVIAHRLSTIQKADQVFLMDGGRLVESGSYEELSSRNGRFRRMLTEQGIIA